MFKNIQQMQVYTSARQATRRTEQQTHGELITGNARLKNTPTQTRRECRGTPTCCREAVLHN